MTRRELDTAALLASLLDAPFAQPKTWTGELVRRNAVRGETPGNRIACPACRGQKRRRGRGGVVVDCDRCLSAKTHKPLGWITVDLNIDERYRRKLSTVQHGLVLQLKTVRCDVCGGSGETLAPRYRGERDRCERCAGGGVLEMRLEAWRASRLTLRAEAPLRAGDPVLDCMESRTRAGSYDELLLALAALHEAWPSLYRLTRDRYVLGVELRSERLERLAYEGGLRFLVARMPAEIRVPGSVKQRRREASAA